MIHKTSLPVYPPILRSGWGRSAGRWKSVPASCSRTSLAARRPDGSGRSAMWMWPCTLRMPGTQLRGGSRPSEQSPRTWGPMRWTWSSSTRRQRPWLGESSRIGGLFVIASRSGGIASSPWRFANSWTFASSSIGCWPGGTRVVDRDLVLRKLADLDQYLEQLSEYRDMTVE